LVWLGGVSDQQVNEALSKLDYYYDPATEDCERGDALESATAEASLQPRLQSEPRDCWDDNAAHCTRVHVCARRKLFTPLRVPSAPAAKSLFTVRLTVGRFIETGETFQILDNWHAREASHRDLEAPWKGYTQFLRRSEPARA
jgi:hypothetical protein